LHYLVSLVFYVQLWIDCNDFRFCVSGSTAAIQGLHTGDEGWSLQVRVLLETGFSFNNFLKYHCMVKVTNTELQDIN